MTSHDLVGFSLEWSAVTGADQCVLENQRSTNNIHVLRGRYITLKHFNRATLRVPDSRSRCDFYDLIVPLKLLFREVFFTPTIIVASSSESAANKVNPLNLSLDLDRLESCSVSFEDHSPDEGPGHDLRRNAVVFEQPNMKIFASRSQVFVY